MRKKVNKKWSVREKKLSFKDASTQTYRYVEYMPPPIIIDFKTEDESDGAGSIADALNHSDSEADDLLLDSVKVEVDEVTAPSSHVPQAPTSSSSSSVHLPPVEEFYFEEKINVSIKQPDTAEIEHQPVANTSPKTIETKPKKKRRTQSDRKENGTKRKRTRVEKSPRGTKRTKKWLEDIDCSLCNFTCKRPSHLKRHMLMHTGEKPHRCEHCPKGFAQKTDLNRHYITHAANYDFHCTLCGRGFPDNDTTKKHELKCNTKRYLCDECSYMTFSVGNLELHKRKHTGERPFACGSCDKRFTRVAHLNQHVKLHANDFEMHCQQCGRGFSDEHELLQHEVTCKNRMFQCHMCRDIHLRMDNLRRHIKITHMGEKEVLCEYCSKQFPAKSSLNKHIKFKHPDRLQ